MENYKGFYGIIEGNDGTGKSTQVEMLADWLRDEVGIAEVYTAHEPAGCPISDELRTIIKNGELERDPLTNALLFTAARRALWLQQAEPVLDRGGVVLTARSDISTVVYQGYGEGVDIQTIRDMTTRYMPKRYQFPDWQVYLDVDDSTREQRIAQRGEITNPDTFEAKDAAFQQRLRDGYRAEATHRGMQRVDAGRPIDAIQHELRARVKPHLSHCALRNSN